MNHMEDFKMVDRQNILLYKPITIAKQIEIFLQKMLSIADWGFKIQVGRS